MSGGLELEERSWAEAGWKWVTGTEGGRLGTEGEGGSWVAKWTPKYNRSYKAKNIHAGQWLLEDRQSSKGRALPRRDFSPHNSISKSTILAPAWRASREISNVCCLISMEGRTAPKTLLVQGGTQFPPLNPISSILGHSSPVPLSLHFSAPVND